MKRPEIAARPGAGWNWCLSLKTPADPGRGWHPDEVSIEREARPFALPQELRRDYETYVERNYLEKGFARDGGKLMLVRNPAFDEDASRLVLRVRDCLYSEVQFYRDCVAPEPELRDALLDETCLLGELRFPSSLCLHLVVVTADDRILLARRSPDAGYYPNAWACSLEEQMEPQDLDGEGDVVTRWVDRALSEELFVEGATDDVRVLSTFLECDIMNAAVCSFARLKLDAAELDRVLAAAPPEDRELVDHAFLDPADLEARQHAAEEPAFHPATGYRMQLERMRRSES